MQYYFIKFDIRDIINKSGNFNKNLNQAQKMSGVVALRQRHLEVLSKTYALSYLIVSMSTV